MASGPMVTAVGGYPTQSWGRNGYGLECVDADAAVAAVDRLASEGARLIKLPVTGDPQLDDDALAAAVAEAHRLGVKVATHALTDEDAARAAIAGVDVLAHTPTEALSEATVSAWSTRTVVTTLVAFGNTPTTRANLSALRAAGTRVLYGTDFGNAQEAAINAQEVQGMLDAGMSGEAILNAGTYDAARFWGFTTLGAIEVGGAASLLVLDADPRADPLTLTRPVAVYMDGRSRSGGG
jgi:imidazolonepropionase-like amidohydrolase